MTQRTLQRVIAAQRTSDGAGVTLHRSIGQSQFARLDPFLMLDEFGSDVPDEYIAGFPAHPHRGFETVTYMLAGRMRHEDHLGNVGLLGPGDVQWMTAGRGIIHSEMPQQESGLMRGFQLWLNLPAREKMRPAAYRDIAAHDIPVYDDPTTGARIKIIAGEWSQAGEVRRGPVAGTSTNPVFLDVHLPSGKGFESRLPESHAAFVYVYEGALHTAAGPAGAGVGARQAGLFGAGTQLEVRAAELHEARRSPADSGVRFLLLAAAPLGEPVVQYGPFVMNTREEIEQALADYRSGRLVR